MVFPHNVRQQPILRKRILRGRDACPNVRFRSARMHRLKHLSHVQFQRKMVCEYSLPEQANLQQRELCWRRCPKTHLLPRSAGMPLLYNLSALQLKRDMVCRNLMLKWRCVQQRLLREHGSMHTRSS